MSFFWFFAIRTGKIVAPFLSLSSHTNSQKLDEQSPIARNSLKAKAENVIKTSFLSKLPFV